MSPQPRRRISPKEPAMESGSAEKRRSPILQINTMKTSSYTRLPGIPAEVVEENITAIIGTTETDPQELKKLSPVEIPAFGQPQASKLLQIMYEPHEHVNVLSKRPGVVGKPGKAKLDRGLSYTQQTWVDILTKADICNQDCDYIFTINPVCAVPSAPSGFYSDVDCTDWRYLLAECDEISLPRQAALLTRLPLPIKAIISSGGRSLHAILEISAKDERSYRDIARPLLRTLRKVGFDPSCGNPSRKSRLPGFIRVDPTSKEVRQQELLYINPSPTLKAIV